jgi:major intracellular serine protease
MASIANKDWGFIDFKIDEIWKLSRGKDIKVAILDSGLNSGMDDFKGNKNISFHNAVTGSETASDCQDDATGHGTDCSGILCAQGRALNGVAPEIMLLVVKITNEKGERTSEAILKGLAAAISFGSDVISLSFSMAKDANFDLIHTRIKEAYNKDIVVLGATGDSGSLDFPVDNFPASFPECLSIGGIDQTRKRSKYSARSNFLDLMGPGENLMSVYAPGKKINGTSFSTPFVAGVIALLKSIAKGREHALSNIELYDILKRTADIKVSDNYNLIDYGWGVLDPVAAMNLISTK